MTDNDGATSAPKTIAVTSNANVAPIARMTSTPTPATGKAPLNVTFNGSTSSDSDGVIASWTLDFGDGTTAASGLGLPSSVPHTYAAGNWTATLTVSDDNGASNSTTIAVTVAANVAPTARLTSNPSPASGKAPLSVSFNGSTSSDSDGTIASWSLAYGDGATNSGTGAVPASTGTHSYAAGSYTAVLTVTDNNGATGTASVPVSVNAPPVARLFVNNNKTSGPAPLSVTFDGLPEHGCRRNDRLVVDSISATAAHRSADRHRPARQRDPTHLREPGHLHGQADGHRQPERIVARRTRRRSPLRSTTRRSPTCARRSPRGRCPWT